MRYFATASDVTAMGDSSPGQASHSGRVHRCMDVRARLLFAFAFALTASPANAEGERALPIAARRHAPEAPPQGWCGETAIQEALLYFGVWAPQARINASAKPAHPDLYSNDVPVALAALGARFEAYRAGAEPYVRFVRRAIDEGDPVIAGVKILPTEHPSWGLDHFVLVVGQIGRAHV